MKVFLSWSGAISQLIARELLTWLPKVINGVQPWLSDADVLGGPWNPQLVGAIKQSPVGIACLTQENLNSEWLHFECGAIACHAKHNLIIPYGLDVASSDLRPPLSFFQFCEANRTGTEKMIRMLATHARRLQFVVSPNLDALVQAGLPELEARLASLSAEYGVGLRAPYRIPALVGFDYRDVIDASTKEIVIVGQNLRTLLGGAFLDHISSLFATRSEFQALFVLAVPEFFDVLTTSPEAKQRYAAEYGRTVQLLRKLQSSLRDPAPGRLRVFAHPGACSLSAIFRDPSDPRRGLVAFTPKWATDAAPNSRIVCIIRRSEHEPLFHALYGHVAVMSNPEYARGLDDL
jgi:hypothetical protein